jgi:acyl dehydratase
MSYPSWYWDDVAEGQALPGFDYELSLLRLVAYVRATGLYDFVHFDRDYARTVGAQDAFISTFHLAGLFSRLITDWAGPGAVLRQLTFSMAAQMMAGDMMQFSGRTGQKSVSPDGEHWLEITDINVATPAAPNAARASAIIAMPARDGSLPLVSRPRPTEAGAGPNPDMPDWARAMLGEVKPGKMQPHLPLSWQELHLWCEALEDWNPLYWDADYAAQSPYRGLIGSPPSMFYGVGSSCDFGIGQGKPGATVPEPVKRGLTGAELRAELRTLAARAGIPFAPPDCPDVVVTQARFDFFAPLRVGDTIRSELRLTDCSARRKTRLGEGYFLTVEDAHFNQRDELVKTMTMSLFYYQP